MVVFIADNCLLPVGLFYKHLLRYDRKWVLSCNLHVTSGLCEVHYHTNTVNFNYNLYIWYQYALADYFIAVSLSNIGVNIPDDGS
jgi:uncharacterized membrane protein